MIRRILKWLALCVLAVVPVLALRSMYRLAYGAFVPRLKPPDEIVVAGRTLGELQGDMHFYFGNLHTHTGASDGIGTARQSLFCARHLMHCDFWAITDHGWQLSDSEWEEAGRETTGATEEGRFVALRGFEAGRDEPHVGVLQTDACTKLEPARSLRGFLDWAVEHGGLLEYNHPRPRHVDSLTDPASREHLTLMETGNKESGNASDEYLPHYQRALDRGARVAPADNHDAHNLLQQMMNPHRTVVITRRLTAASILEALHARRVYASDDPNQKVLFKLGDAWMGSVVNLAVPAPVTFAVYVEDDEPIVGIELVSKAGRVVAHAVPDARQVVWQPTVSVTAGSFFYLRITGRDMLLDEVLHRRQVTVTAPIWVTVAVSGSL